MALVISDRVRETCAAPGTGTVTLLGPVTGYVSFSVIGNGNTTYYCISDQGNNNWEVGIGTYTASGTTLSRDTVLDNSAGTTAKINFSAGTQDVFVTLPASKSRTITSDTAPSNPTNGDNWYNTTDGVTYVYYVSGSTGQWVDTTPFMNTPNQWISLYCGKADVPAFDVDLIVSGGGAGYSNYPFFDFVDGGIGSNATTGFTTVTGGQASTAFNLFGEAIDGGVAINIV
jgi:hypothetical protein